MSKRFMSIWFYQLAVDRFLIRQPDLKGYAFVLASIRRGRSMIHASSPEAQQAGIKTGMPVADAKAVLPALEVCQDEADNIIPLLEQLAIWFMRYTPVVATDNPDGLLLDISGCAHLWGGERQYVQDIQQKMNRAGYHVRIAIADTAGAAWAVARYGTQDNIIAPGEQQAALLSLPAAALRLDEAILQRMDKLGLYRIHHFIRMPRTALRRRFGSSLAERLDQALGAALEVLQPVEPVPSFLERLLCPEPIRTATAIEFALKQLLEQLCDNMATACVGLRTCVLKAYRTDSTMQQIQIDTGCACRDVAHLLKLLLIKTPVLEPDLGFEVFVLEAPVTEEMTAVQDKLWALKDKADNEVAALLDRVAVKVGADKIRRYLPEAHYWPERSLRLTTSMKEQSSVMWQSVMLRPIHLLPSPEQIEVVVPRPDYPPIMFRYKDRFYKIQRADGPERMAPEWWLEQNVYRDYYCVEDEEGCRYWLYRSGGYEDAGTPGWFIHGFFA